MNNLGFGFTAPTNVQNGIQAQEQPTFQNMANSSDASSGQTAPNAGTNAVRMDGILIESLGLSPTAIQASNGKQAADNIPLAVQKLSDVNNLPAETRIEVGKALLNWQSIAFRDIRSQALHTHHKAVLSGIIGILRAPDDNVPGDYTSSGGQVPALLLTRLLQHEAHESSEFSNELFPSLVGCLDAVMNSGVLLKDKEELGTPFAASIRVETLRTLVRCFPMKSRDLQQVKTSINVLLHLLNYAELAPLLQMEASQHIQAIGVDQEEDPSLYTILWGERVHDLLSAIKKGHPELKRILKKNKALFSVRSRKMEEYLGEMIDALGMGEMEEFLQQLADQDPSKLLSAIPTFVKQLGTAIMKHKFLIMAMFLAIALVVGAGPLLPVLGAIGAVATVTPPLFIPFFKLLTVIAAAGDEPAVQCLYMVARIAKSGLIQSDQDKAAVLDAVNIIKDKFSYSNIFSQDTLAVLEDFSECNKAAYQNIVKWNQGKSARKGDRKDYIMNAGRVSKATKGASWFSPKKKYGASAATPSKLGAVGPSPQSQILSMYNEGAVYGSLPLNDVRPPSPTHTGLSLPMTPLGSSARANGTSATYNSTSSAVGYGGILPPTSSSTTTAGSNSSPAKNLFPLTDNKNNTTVTTTAGPAPGAGAGGVMSFSDFVAASAKQQQQSSASSNGVAASGDTGSTAGASTDGGAAQQQQQRRSWSPFGRRSRPTSPSPHANGERPRSRSSERRLSRKQQQQQETEAHRQRDEALARELQQLKLQVSRLEGNLN